MSTKTITVTTTACDRCGNSEKDAFASGYARMRVERGSRGYDGASDGATHDYDLCARCAQAFDAFMSTKPAAAAESKPVAPALAEKCTFDIAYVGPCGHRVGPGGKFCPKHDAAKCVSCGAPATRTCSMAYQFVCGAPLCDDCFDDGKGRHARKETGRS